MKKLLIAVAVITVLSGAGVAVAHADMVFSPDTGYLPTQTISVDWSNVPDGEYVYVMDPDGYCGSFATGQFLDPTPYYPIMPDLNAVLTFQTEAGVQCDTTKQGLWRFVDYNMEVYGDGVTYGTFLNQQ